METSKAVETLVAASRQDKKLEGPVFVQVALPEASSSSDEPSPLHPILLPLPHSFRRRDETVTCLVVKDPGHAVAQQLDQCEATTNLFDEVIGVGKLRRRVAKGRRSTGKTSRAADEFAKTFTLIFVHEKVREPLADCLGMGFYKRSKHLPIPVSFSLDNENSLRELKFVVKAAARSAQLVLRPASKVTSIRVGHTRMDEQKLVDNIEAAVKLCKDRIPRGHGTEATYYIKTPDSLAIKLV